MYICAPVPYAVAVVVLQAEERALLDDVFMSTKERELNRRLLTAARSALDSVRPA